MLLRSWFTLPYEARTDPALREAAAPSRTPVAGVHSPVRVLLAARVRLYREGLRDALRSQPGIDLVASCATAADLLRLVPRLNPQVVVLDLSLCRERPVAREIGDLDPSVKILALAVDDRQMDGLMECASAGVSGWVGNDATLDELVSAVRHVARGELMCSPRQAAMLYRRMSDLLGPADSGPQEVALTPRECDVGRLLARGMSNKGISRTLGIGVATVKNHVHNILSKLEVSSRTEATPHLVRILTESDASLPRPP